MRITLDNGLLELIVVLSGPHPGGRGRYELGGVERCDLVPVHVTGERPVEDAFIPLEELPYAGFHPVLSRSGQGLCGPEAETVGQAVPWSSGLSLPQIFSRTTTSSTPVCELRQNINPGRPESSRALTTVPSIQRTRAPAVT